METILRILEETLTNPSLSYAILLNFTYKQKKKMGNERLDLEAL
jgi:hypothetical protein